jgi:hypothetical protein
MSAFVHSDTGNALYMPLTRFAPARMNRGTVFAISNTPAESNESWSVMKQRITKGWLRSHHKSYRSSLIFLSHAHP